MLLTQPNVLYKVTRKKEEHFIRTPVDFPKAEELKVVRLEEPMALVTIILPSDCLGRIIELCSVLNS